MVILNARNVVVLMFSIAGEHTLGKALRECAPWTLLEILVRVDYKQYEFW